MIRDALIEIVKCWPAVVGPMVLIVIIGAVGLRRAGSINRKH